MNVIILKDALRLRIILLQCSLSFYLHDIEPWVEGCDLETNKDVYK